jgi:hypothetical protein
MRQALASQVAEASLALQQVPRLQKMDCFSVLVGQEVKLRELKDVIGLPCALRPRSSRNVRFVPIFGSGNLHS